MMCVDPGLVLDALASGVAACLPEGRLASRVSLGSGHAMALHGVATSRVGGEACAGLLPCSSESISIWFGGERGCPETHVRSPTCVIRRLSRQHHFPGLRGRCRWQSAAGGQRPQSSMSPPHSPHCIPTGCAQGHSGASSGVGRVMPDLPQRFVRPSLGLSRWACDPLVCASCLQV